MSKRIFAFFSCQGASRRDPPIPGGSSGPARQTVETVVPFRRTGRFTGLKPTVLMKGKLSRLRRPAGMRPSCQVGHPIPTRCGRANPKAQRRKGLPVQPRRRAVNIRANRRKQRKRRRAFVASNGVRWLTQITCPCAMASPRQRGSRSAPCLSFLCCLLFGRMFTAGKHQIDYRIHGE